MQPNPIVTGIRPLQIPSGNAALEADAASARPPEFPRAPREYIPFPDDEVSILLPSAAPTPPANSLITVFMSFLSAAVMGSIYIFSSNGKTPAIAYASLTIGVLSLSFGLFSYFTNKKKFKQQVEQRRLAYGKYLEKRTLDLSNLANAQREASLAAHPALNVCARVAAQRTPTRLWDRENGDPDFLDIRLGIGESASTFSVTVPQASQFQITPDPLEEKARSLLPEFSMVANLAVALPLAQIGAVGWVGVRELLIKALRASILHLASHHAPNEVKLILVCPPQENVEWEWVRWLPHNWSDGHEMRFFGNGKASQASVMAHLENILKQRMNLLASRSDAAVLPVPIYVIAFADINLWRGTEAIKFSPVLDLILKNGPKLGVFPLFLAGQVSRVPKACKAIIEIQANAGTLKFLGTNPKKYAFTPDLLELKPAWEMAQSLAPIRLEEAGGGAANLPGTVTLLELISAARIEEINVLEIWNQSRPFESLAVPMGVGAGGKRLLLDLHEKAHGPHGLVAGTTGSGKTALLSTYLALAALYYHPHELGFIGIDFKGGDLIRELKDLPHMIGTLTNLDNSGTDRAIKILRGEVKKRQARFNRAGIGNIYDYQKMHRQKDPVALEPMPHLLIVCDEFAELKKEQPDFIRELVSLSRVGRSLGIHLILATQKPAGVVSDEIWANSHFHLCLKVASLDDSREMLRRPEAAEITQKGRAYFQVGMNEVFELFQAAWGDAPYIPQDGISRQPRIISVEADGSRQEIWPPRKTSPGNGQTQIHELARHILQTCRQNNIQRLEGIWPPALNEQAGKTLEQVLPPGQGWNGKGWPVSSQRFQPVLGILDNPELQQQELLRIDLENNGHFALFGAPGSGKTTALQTLVTSLACEHTPAQVNLYLIDYAGRTFTIFENLPHVGAVITNGESERLRRLFTLLNEEMERRKKLVENDQNLLTFRKNHPQASEPEIFVFLDGYSHFAESFKNQITTTEIDNLVRLASQGANLGMHLVIATDQVKSFPSKLLGNIKDVAATELNDTGDYVSILGRTGGLFPPKDAPGRGLIKGLPVMEFQAALPAESALQLKIQAETMNLAWQGDRPRLVPALPDLLALSDLLHPGAAQSMPKPGLPLTIGLNTSRPSLPPYEINLASGGPHFWISGLSQSGKTSLLQTWLLGLAECYSPQIVRFYLVDLGWGGLEALKALPHTIGCITDANELKTLRLQDELKDFLAVDHSGARPVAYDDPAKPSVIFVVDGFGAFGKALTSDFSDKEKIGDLNRNYLLALLRVRNARFHLLAAGGPAEFSGGMASNPLGETLRSFQSGFWLGDGTNGEASNLNFQFAPGETLKGLPRGAGFQINRGSCMPLKFSTCQLGSPAMEEWIRKIAVESSD